MFKDCITAVRSCHACQIFDCKTRIPPTPLHLVVVVGPFTKWGIDFMTRNPTSAGGHGYIIVTVDYFTKLVEAMPTLNNSGEIAALFVFNHVVSRFGVPQDIVIDHGSHFRNHMMVEFASKLGLSQNNSTPYYPWCIAWKRAYQFSAKFHLSSSQLTFSPELQKKRLVSWNQSNWMKPVMIPPWLMKHIRNELRRSLTRMLNPVSSQKLVYCLEAGLQVQCEISSLKIAIDLLPRTSKEEAHFLELIQLDETHHETSLANEAHKK
eukprot:PITA_33152